MEDAENQPQMEAVPEQRYPVALRPPLFSYLVESLRPAYQRELDEKREDGSYADLQQFHKSRIASLMGEMLDQFTDPEELPPAPVLSLSEEDLKFLEGKIPNPSDAGGSMLRREMTRELKDNFGDAKGKARINALTSKIKSKFQR